MAPPDGTAPRVSVVVPVLNEEALLPELRRRLQGALEPVAGGHEIVFVDDGSTDGSAPMIEHWTQEDDSIMLVQLSRNFGMDVAMSAGLDYASGDWVCLLHADLQDPPELIPEMLAMAEAGADVVYARRIGREDSRMKRWLAIAFYAVMERLAQVPYQGQAGDFRLMSRRVVEVVRQMPERRRFLRGMVAWSGFTQVPIEYRRAGRLAGRGATYPELFRLAIEAVTSFSDVPLSLATYAGITTSATSAAAAVALLLLTIAGVVSASGTVWLAAVVLFLAGMQLITVGIIGRYLARVHHEILHRPLYIVARTVRRGSQRTDG